MFKKAKKTGDNNEDNAQTEQNVNLIQLSVSVQKWLYIIIYTVNILIQYSR